MTSSPDSYFPPWLTRLLHRYPTLRRYPHPLAIHFPIVFFLSATFFTLLYLATGDGAWESTAFHCLGGGVITLPVAICTGLFTAWLNFSAESARTAALEKKLSFLLQTAATTAWLWRWLDPRVLLHPAGLNLLYLLLVLSLTPLVAVISFFGGMLTFPLEVEVMGPTPQEGPDEP